MRGSPRDCHRPGLEAETNRFQCCLGFSGGMRMQPRMISPFLLLDLTVTPRVRETPLKSGLGQRVESWSFTSSILWGIALGPVRTPSSYQRPSDFSAVLRFCRAGFAHGLLLAFLVIRLNDNVFWDTLGLLNTTEICVF